MNRLAFAAAAAAVLPLLQAPAAQAAIAKIDSFVVVKEQIQNFYQDNISYTFTLTWDTSGLGGEYAINRRWDPNGSWTWVTGNSYSNPPGTVSGSTIAYPHMPHYWLNVHVGNAGNPVATDNAYQNPQ